MAKYSKKLLATSVTLLLGASASAFALDSNVIAQDNASYKNVLNNLPNEKKLDAKQTYDAIFDIYEDYFKHNVRFADDGSAIISGREWFDDIETVGINRERAKTQFIPFDTPEKAFLAEKSVLDDIDASSSKYYKKLSNAKWDFALVDNPQDALKKDKEFLAKDYDGKEFNKEMVPAAWQTYKNEDGTFKYDEPMYTNHGFPWQNNIQEEDYKTPKAPTVHNPIGYYRTSFTLDKDWDGREVFISLQSVESAYYLYVNGKAVGYSTDSFTAHDFNITPYLQKGKNTIALKVFRWSIGSWLENQDFIRQSGIYRDVYLYSKGEAEIRDFYVKTDFVDHKNLVNSDVRLKVETTVRGLKNLDDKVYTVKATLKNKDGDIVAEAKDREVNVKKAGQNSRDKLLDKGSTITSYMLVKNPEKWFPDTPNLYYLELTLQDKEGHNIESIVERVGFRDLRKVFTTTTNENGKYLEQLQINGKQLVLRGVNRHDADLNKGHAVGFEEYLQDLSTMKQNNLNAIRTSHYPNDAIMFELADELGLYLCVDANIESHRAAFTGARVPTGPLDKGEYKEWVGALLDRNANMIEHYKNNPSVVIWSSNNEAQYGKVQYNSHSGFWVASMYALKRDPSRFRKSERASAYQDQVQIGDPWSLESRMANIVDLHSTQYALPSGVALYNNVQPYVHSEYNHAMGQAYGNAKEHWDVIRKRDNVNGGFIWDYIDQSILTYDKESGKTFYGYGGDWSDKIYNDNAFCANGLVYADHSESPKIKDAKKIHQQVNFYMKDKTISTKDQLEIKMVNEYEHTPLKNFDIKWTIYKNNERNKPIAMQVVDSELKCLQGQSISTNFEYLKINLPRVLKNFKPEEGADYFLDFSVTLKQDTNYGAKKGFEVAYEQFKLDFSDKVPQEVLNVDNIRDFESIVDEDNTVTLTGLTDNDLEFEIVLNKEKGTIDKYMLDGENIIISGPEQSIFRAQTYNDTTAYWSQESQNAGHFDNLSNVKVNVDTQSKSNKVEMSMSASMKVDASISMNYEIYGNGDIVVLDNFTPRSDFAKVGGLPKVGSRLIINNEFDNFTYYGRGPFDTYVDRETGARIATYNSKVADNFDRKLMKPQEHGNHTDVRWTTLTNEDGLGLLISSHKELEVSALPFTAEELNPQAYDNAKYRHPIDVPLRVNSLVWNIDLKQRGVSDTAFMDHTPLDGYQVPTSKSYSYSYRISPINEDSDVEKIAFEKYPLDIENNIVKAIYVNGKALDNFNLNTKEYKYTLENDAKDLVVTAYGSAIHVVDLRNGTFEVSGSIDGVTKTFLVHIDRQRNEVSSDVKAKVTLVKEAPLVNGKAEPIPTIETSNNKILIDGVDFSVRYENNTKEGEMGRAIIELKGVYKSKPIVQEFKVVSERALMRTISFNTDGGSTLEPMLVENGVILVEKSLQIPTKDGFIFGGWWNYNFTQAFDFNQAITQNTTLYARWIKEEAKKEVSEVIPAIPLTQASETVESETIVPAMPAEIAEIEGTTEIVDASSPNPVAAEPIEIANAPLESEDSPILQEIIDKEAIVAEDAVANVKAEHAQKALSDELDALEEQKQAEKQALLEKEALAKEKAQDENRGKIVDKMLKVKDFFVNLVN